MSHTTMRFSRTMRQSGSNELTQDLLKSMIVYEKETGRFIRTANANRVLVKTKNAGSTNANGYVYISVNCKKYLAHRLAFLYVTGSFPVDFVDHVNGNRADNRWENLRDVTHSQNMQNVGRAQINNTSGGFLGVSFRKRFQRYEAEITVNGKSKYLGRFKTAEDAHKVYMDAKQRFHPFSSRAVEINQIGVQS